MRSADGRRLETGFEGSSNVPRKTRVATFTDEGVDRFRLYIEGVRSGVSSEDPSFLWADDALIADVSGTASVEHMDFSSKLDLARYLRTALNETDTRVVKTEPKMWTWLACFFFEQLCPTRDDGTRRVHEQARYVMDCDFARYYRHAIAGPCIILSSARGDDELVELLLYGPPAQTNDFIGQIAARQRFLQNLAILQAARALYWDEERKLPKRGSSPRKKKPGTLRRFVDLHEQLDLTYDLFALDGDGILELLPAEFDRWSNGESLLGE